MQIRISSEYIYPAIIGAYEAGRQNICCIVGDGSIMMNLQELQIVSYLKIPVKIFVISLILILCMAFHNRK